MNTLALLLVLGASVFDTTFESGNTAYAEGRHADAAREYTRLVESGVDDPVVLYNLGNAQYRLGQLGPAIANFERALSLSPGMAEAEHNLRLAVSKAPRGLEKPLPPAWEQALLFWHYRMPYHTSRALAIFGWTLFWALVALRAWRPIPRLRIAATLVFFGTLAFATSAWYKAQPSPLAVAQAETVPVRYGKSEAESVYFELLEGDRVLVDSREDGWARVSTVDGRRGWARDADLYFAGPPNGGAP